MEGEKRRESQEEEEEEEGGTTDKGMKYLLNVIISNHLSHQFCQGPG